jgi:hypothetical protein
LPLVLRVTQALCQKICWPEKYLVKNTNYGAHDAVLNLWVFHPVAHLSNWFLMMPSIATKFQYVNKKGGVDILKLCCDWRHHKESDGSSECIFTSRHLFTNLHNHKRVLSLEDRECCVTNDCLRSV